MCAAEMTVMRTTFINVTLGAAIVATFPAPAHAQFKNGNQTVTLNLPRVSQHAVITQRIGLTDITIAYHRPLVDGRKIFGDVVPYGRVWRAGANDNTTIEFTDPVTVEGQQLSAGRYGVHMIPGESEWTIIFSRNSTSWGSFSYDRAEDALRVQVKPRQGTAREELTYEFTNLKPDSVTVALAWEQVVVPFTLAVDTRAITLASLRREMRHLPGFKAETFFEAALYCVDNDFNYEEARQWIDRAIAEEERFEHLELKSQILERTGHSSEAAALLAKALTLASPQQMYGYGDRLIREKRLGDAKTLFERLTREHPDAWVNWYGLARVQVALGDREGAKRTLEASQPHAATPQQKAGLKRILERLAAGQGIG
jgi:hypothetical protein